MRDSTPAILTIVLLLLALVCFLGYRDLQVKELERQLEYSEAQWERAVEKRREKRERWCLGYAMAYANNLDYLTFDPEVPMSVYDLCIRP